jgi:galactose mutarotase-like enzyme
MGGEIEVNGKQFPLGRHGFARFEKFSILAQRANSIRFQLLPNAETLKGFPFQFVFETEYTIAGNTIHQSFLVKNTDQVPFAFQLGGHPAFAVPCGQYGEYSDHSIVLDKKGDFARHLLTKGGLFSGEKRPFMQDTDRFDLYHDLFAEDAIVFKNEGISEASLVNKRTGKYVKMRFEGFPHLGVWSVPGAGYVCIEPWIGCADDDGGTNDLFKKDHAIVLQPAETFSAEFSIEIGE